MSVAPVYPDSAKKYGIEGDLVVWFIVDTIGRPQCAIILHKIGNGMDEAALLAIQEWRFKPVIVNGKKQISPMTMPFRFQINNKKKSRAG
jgi:TonB family protein